MLFVTFDCVESNMHIIVNHQNHAYGFTSVVKITHGNYYHGGHSDMANTIEKKKREYYSSALAAFYNDYK